MEKTTNQKTDLISRIVRQELEAAERISPEDERKKRLADRLEIGKAVSFTPHPFLLRRFKVLASALVAAVIVLVILSTLFSNGQTLGLSRYIEQQGKTFQSTAAMPSRQDKKSAARRPGDLTDESGQGYSRLFLARLPSEHRVTGGSALLPPRNVRRLSFEETVRVLYFDRYLDKFLSEYARKNKEV